MRNGPPTLRVICRAYARHVRFDGLYGSFVRAFSESLWQLWDPVKLIALLLQIYRLLHFIILQTNHGVLY